MRLEDIYKRATIFTEDNEILELLRYIVEGKERTLVVECTHLSVSNNTATFYVGSYIVFVLYAVSDYTITLELDGETGETFVTEA